MFTLLTIMLLITSGLVAGYSITATLGLVVIASFVARMGGSYDTDRLSAWFFSIAAIWILLAWVYFP